VLLSLFAQMQLHPSLCYVQGMTLGRVVKSVAWDQTAFPHRDGTYISDAECDYENNDGTEKFAMGVVESYVSELTKLGMCQGAFLNFPYEAPGFDFADAYWKGNVERLVSIKQRWNPDPNNVLKYPQQVPSAYTPRPVPSAQTFRQGPYSFGVNSNSSFTVHITTVSASNPSWTVVMIAVVIIAVAVLAGLAWIVINRKRFQYQSL